MTKLFNYLFFLIIFLSGCLNKKDGLISDPIQAIKKNDIAGVLFQQYLFGNEDISLVYEALDSVNLAIKLDKKNPVFFFNKANFLMELDSAESAVKAYSEILKIDSSNAAAAEYKGLLLLEMGEKELALESFLKALNIYNERLAKEEDFIENMLAQRAFLYLFIYSKAAAVLEIDKLLNDQPDNIVFRIMKEQILEYDLD